MKFLIAEDDVANQKVLEAYLSPLGSCVIVANGREAIEAHKEAIQKHEPFDLVCLDIMMPEVDGVAALQQIRDFEAENGLMGMLGTKIIMITAVADKDTVIGAFRNGCEAYLIKPIDRNELMRNLRVLKLIS